MAAVYQLRVRKCNDAWSVPDASILPITTRQVIRLFLEKANNKTELCNARDADSKTPFDLAVQNKHNAVVKLLKEMGDPNAQSAACRVM